MVQMTASSLALTIATSCGSTMTITVGLRLSKTVLGPDNHLDHFEGSGSQGEELRIQ